MDSQFISPISIEKFAAYLDGNLSEAEMHSISLLIDGNEDLQEIIDTNDSIEDTYDYNDFVGEADIPNEIERMDFEIPNLDTVNTPFDSNEVYSWEADIAACADETVDIEIPLFKDNPLVDSDLQQSDNNNLLMTDIDTEIDMSSSDLDTDFSFLDNYDS